MPIKWNEGLRQQIGRESKFYRQNYCGCEFSIRTPNDKNTVHEQKIIPIR